MTTTIPIPRFNPENRVAQQPVLVTVDGQPVLDLRARLGMTREAFARLMGVSPRTIQAMERDQAAPDRLRRPYAEVARLYRALSEIVPRSVAARWFITTKRFTGGFLPLELIERGETDRLWEWVLRERARRQYPVDSPARMFKQPRQVEKLEHLEHVEQLDHVKSSANLNKLNILDKLTTSNPGSPLATSSRRDDLRGEDEEKSAVKLEQLEQVEHVDRAKSSASMNKLNILNKLCRSGSA